MSKNDAVNGSAVGAGFGEGEGVSEWREVTLQDVVSKLGDGLHGTPEYDDTGDYFFINGNNLSNGKIIVKENTRRTTKKEYEKYYKELNERTILVSINGTLGNTAFYNNEPCILGKSACYFNVIEGVDKYYIRYILTDKNFQEYIRNFAHGSTIQNVSLKTMREYSFLLPPLPEQKAIASVLSSLDDKIDLLHRQNKTLEAIAETLFRQWFIEEAQEDWDEGTVQDYCIHYKEGIKPQDFPTKTFSHYSIPSFDQNMNPVSESGSEIRSNKYSVVPYCLLFSKLNPNKDKRIWLILDQPGENPICSTEFQVVLPKEQKHLYFIYGWLSIPQNYNEIASSVGGTSGSHQRIDPADIFNFPCPRMDETYLDQFNAKVEPLFRSIQKNHIQIRTLEKLRDTLLPKLMSGEVRITL